MGKGKKKNKKAAKKIRAAGNIVKITNTKPYPASNEFYLSMRGKITDGMLFRIKEELGGRSVKKAQALGEQLNNLEVEFLFTFKQLVDAIYRAHRNPEDVPKVGMITNLLEGILQ